MKLWLTRVHGNATDGRRTRWHMVAAIDALDAARVYAAWCKTQDVKMKSAWGVDVVPQRTFTGGHIDVAIDKSAKPDQNELRDRYRHDGAGDVVASEFSKLWDWAKFQHVRL